MVYCRAKVFHIGCWLITLLSNSKGAEITTLMKIISSETATPKSSNTLNSLLECLSWGQMEPVDAISYDPGSGACAINELPLFSVYKAISQPEQGSHAYYMDVGCVPNYCPDLETLKTDTDAYPADLIYFAPLAAKSGNSLDVDAYFTSSLTKVAQAWTVQLWDEPFLDGSFPFWQPHGGQQGYIELSPNRVVGSVSVFAWSYFKSGFNTIHRPVTGFHRTHTFNSGFGLSGGGTTSYVDKLIFWITDHISGPHSITSDGAIIKEDVWHHLGATYDATTGESHLYYNGEIIKSANLGTGIQTHLLEAGLLSIGLTLDGTTDISPDNACQGCASLYHEIYERALSPVEMKKIYNKAYCQFPADYCNFY